MTYCNNDAVRIHFNGTEMGLIPVTQDHHIMGSDQLLHGIRSSGTDHDLALGLDIPDTAQRGRGYGSAAMRRMMAYYRGLGHTSFLTQTWSGNERMIALAKKLGFREVSRLRGLRLVNGKSYDALTFRLDFPAEGAERD